MIYQHISISVCYKWDKWVILAVSITVIPLEPFQDHWRASSCVQTWSIETWSKFRSNNLIDNGFAVCWWLLMLSFKLLLSGKSAEQMKTEMVCCFFDGFSLKEEQPCFSHVSAMIHVSVTWESASENSASLLFLLVRFIQNLNWPFSFIQNFQTGEGIMWNFQTCLEK